MSLYNASSLFFIDKEYKIEPSIDPVSYKTVPVISLIIIFSTLLSVGKKKILQIKLFELDEREATNKIISLKNIDQSTCSVGEIHLNHQNFQKKDSVFCDYFNKRELYNHLEQKKNATILKQWRIVFEQYVLGFVVEMFFKAHHAQVAWQNIYFLQRKKFFA